MTEPPITYVSGEYTTQNWQSGRLDGPIQVLTNDTFKTAYQAWSTQISANGPLSADLFINMSGEIVRNT